MTLYEIPFIYKGKEKIATKNKERKNEKERKKKGNKLISFICFAIPTTYIYYRYIYIYNI